jgi:uncharacterized protein YndB with AHSA1/START domain
MAASYQEDSASSADREIVITRLYDAPPELVFAAWTHPNHLVEWWGPDGFRTTVEQMDVRPGGLWKLIMHGPDGRDYHNHMVFEEVAPPRRLVYRHDPEHGSEDASHRATVTFEPRAGKTLVTLHMVFVTAEERERIVEKYHAIEGGRQTLGRLAQYLPRMAELPAEREIVITRVFDAPRELVFACWTTREHLQRWWGPKYFTNPVCDCDARVGGAWYIVMRAPDGSEYPCGGTYLEVVAPERLVFKNDAYDANGDVIIDGLTQVTFADFEGGKTLLTLTSRGRAMNEAMIAALAGMHAGWSQSLEKLAAEFSGA